MWKVTLLNVVKNIVNRFSEVACLDWSAKEGGSGGVGEETAVPHAPQVRHRYLQSSPVP